MNIDLCKKYYYDTVIEKIELSEKRNLQFCLMILYLGEIT